jgi:sortase A
MGYYLGSSYQARTHRRHRIGALGIIFQISLTISIVLCFFVVYEIFGKSIATSAHQGTLNNQIDKTWNLPPQKQQLPKREITPPPGYAVARMYIPRLNKRWVVVEGTTLSDIEYAPGHYAYTALPGQIGNFSVAGHRSPQIFWDLDKMKKGDLIIVETQLRFYTYKVTENKITSPYALDEVYQVPPGYNNKPNRYLTLTTCNPKWDNFQRLIIHAVFIDTTTHDNPPAQVLALS